jgi:hypothetical protein
MEASSREGPTTGVGFPQARERSRVERSEERRIVRIMVVAVPVAALVLVAAGCGGSSSSSEGGTTATIEAADTTATDTTAADTTGGTDTSGTDTTSGDVSIEGCTKLTDLSVKFSQALAEASSGSGAPDLQATAKAYEDFADEVPEEIRDAFGTIAAAFGTYADVLGDLDLSSGKTPDAKTMQKLAEAAQRLDNTKLTAASAEIEAWAKKNCNTGG